MRNKVKIISSIGIFVVMVGSLVGYDVYVKDKINTEDVLVVKEGSSISESQALDGSVLTVEGRPRTQLPEGTITAAEMDKIEGKTASVKIAGNTVLTKDHIDFKDVVPNKEEGEAIRPITTDMIYAVQKLLDVEMTLIFMQ